MSQFPEHEKTNAPVRTVRALFDALERRIPRALSCDWDNDGLMCCPDPDAPVRRVLVALDVTARTVETAVREGYDLIVSHHPLVFHPLAAVNPGDPVAKKVIALLRAGVSVMSFHTRLDAVAGGVNDTLAGALDVGGAVPFGEEGIGRVGTLAEPMALGEFAARVRKVTGAPAVLVADAGQPVRRVAILGGNGSDDVREAEKAGADTYLSGEIAQHHLTDAPERGMNLIAAGHFYTENPVCGTLRKWLLEEAPELTVDLYDSNRIEWMGKAEER